MKNIKSRKIRIIAFLVLTFFIINVFLVAFPAIFARADEEIKTFVSVSLDGKMLSFDALPFIVGQRTIVPVRSLMEALKAKVDWNETERIVTITKDSTSIKLKVGESKATLNGKEILLDTTAYIRYNRVFVPLRFVSENMNLNVNWKPETKTVVLTSKKINDEIKDDKSDNTNVSGPQVNNDNTEDNIFKSISMNKNEITFAFKNNNISYTKMLLTLPDRLVIDIKNCINTLVSYNMPDNNYINSLRYSQFTVNPNYVRFVMELKDKTGYNISVTDNMLKVAFFSENDLASDDETSIESDTSSDNENENNSTDKLPEKDNIANADIKIIIDPGHGGSDPGACGYDASGNLVLKEKDPNLTISLKLYEMLKKSGFDVYMTRDSDTYVSLTGRSDMANNLNADLFISIHNNANDNFNTRGTMVMYAYDTPKENMSISGKQLASVIQKHLVEAIPGTNDYGAVKNSALSVVRRTLMPAVIVESLFVSNEADRNLLMDETVLADIATAVYEGIVEILNIQEN